MSTTPCSTERKRGRPRKDYQFMARNEKRQTQTSTPPSQPSPTATMTPIGDNHKMVGQVVSGVIDGVFDTGYLISIRVGPNNTILRGLVFQQGHFCPITPANDVTPHLNMLRRENFHIPQVACMKEPPQVAMQNYQTTPMMAGGSGNSAMAPPESLRMVGQDDQLMQVFEVSKMVEEQKKNIKDCGHGSKNDHLLSDSDLMADSLPTLPSGARGPVQDVDHKAKRKQQEGEGVVCVNCVEKGMEDPGDKSEKEEGEVSKIDVNQDPNQGVNLVANDLVSKQD